MYIMSFSHRPFWMSYATDRNRCACTNLYILCRCVWKYSVSIIVLLSVIRDILLLPVVVRTYTLKMRGSVEYLLRLFNLLLMNCLISRLD